MTIQVELLNRDTSRSIEVVYHDIVVGSDGAPTGECVDSHAGIIEPGRFQTFWMTSTRNLLIVER